MFSLRSLRLVRLLAVVPACWAAGFATPAMAEDVWSSLATVSASAPLASGRICYSDGRDIACDVNAPTLASLTAPVTLGLNDLTDVTASGVLGSIWAGNLTGGTGTTTVTTTTAFGLSVLRNATTGYNNTAFGYNTLFNSNSGHNNAMFGLNAGYAGTRASYNVAFGNGALQRNTVGNDNVAVGHVAAYGAANAEITRTVAIGYAAGRNLTSSTGNILVGYQAGDAITSGNYNIVIGYDADPVAATGSNQLNIGNTIYGDLGLKRVGIGVTSPSFPLDVTGTSSVAANFGGPNGRRIVMDTGSGAIEFYGVNGASNGYAYINRTLSGMHLIISSGGTGRVGIGTTANTAPSATLQVSGSFMVMASDNGCTTDTIGTMRVNPTTKRLQLCLDR